MSISGISGSRISAALSPSQNKTDETTQQLADQGDPIAIAKLKQEQQQVDPTVLSGVSEPGKGEQIDRYI
jgi:hypothetical protein